MTLACNFAHDTTFYVRDKDLNTLINGLEHYTPLAVQDKCHLHVFGNKHETVWTKIGETKIWKSNKEKLLGVTADDDLLCRNA